MILSKGEVPSPGLRHDTMKAIKSLNPNALTPIESSLRSHVSSIVSDTDSQQSSYREEAEKSSFNGYKFG
jgi:hypothetical protein